MKQYRIHVTGTVQGVFFRHHTRQVAEQLGLAGFARNEPDGSVYIEAEGGEKALATFLAWCKEGPEQATVQQVSYTEHPMAGHVGFEIRHA